MRWVDFDREERGARRLLALAAARAGPTGWPRRRVSRTPLPAPPARRRPDTLTWGLASAGPCPVWVFG